MPKKWKRKILVNNPEVLDRRQIEQDLRDGHQVIVQFSHPDFYGSILEEVDELCARFDEHFGVRFYGHYSLSFDANTLLRVPHVKMLQLNSLAKAHNTEALAKLEQLHSLHIGIYELENGEMLGFNALQSLRDLVILSEKKVLNLQYLQHFTHLEQLHVGGKVKNLDAVGDLENLDYLALHSISKQPLHFVNRLKKLKYLRILLGGREHIQDIEENDIEDLEICRVRGLHDLTNMTAFRSLKSLIIEDQIQLKEIGFDREMPALEDVSIMNCKSLTHVTGLERLSALRKLRMFKTAVEFDSFLNQTLPRSLREVEFATSKSKVDEAIQESLTKLGFQKWGST